MNKLLLEKYTEKVKKCCAIDNDLYQKHSVFRGLRDVNGNGVLTGLTNISEIKAKECVNGVEMPCEGELYYQGYNINNIVQACYDENRFGYEEVCYLLLFGELPNSEELLIFKNELFNARELPVNFIRDVILKRPEEDIMNMMARSILMLHAYDDKANDTSLENVLRQCIQLIALLPIISIYSYNSYCFRDKGDSLFIHSSNPDLSTAENMLNLLRADSTYTKLEAETLDIALLLHGDHGGGNNSTFANHLITSSGTDTYSTFAAAIGALKGPKHGGANSKVVLMFQDLKNNVSDLNDEDEICFYLKQLLCKEAFDRSGLIYGMGHAVYSKSDPRAKIFKDIVKKLSDEKGRLKDFELYSKVERLAPQVISQERKIYKGVNANVDFFSGLVYELMSLPTELYTPLFAIGRIPGWSAHRCEELINSNKIIRPAYKCVKERRVYVDLADR